MHVQFSLNIYYILTNTHIANSIIAKEVINLLALKVRGILRILYMLNVKDGEMRELIFRLGQTSKWSIFDF